MQKKTQALAVLIALFLLAINFQLVLAHESVKVGDYTIEIGWLTEPPIAGQMNGIIVNVTQGDSEEPVENVSNLVVNVTYGGQTKGLILQPLGEDTPGQFVGPILPTTPGQFTVELSGRLGGTDISAQVEPEKVQPPEVIQFPILDTSTWNGGLGLLGWLALLGVLFGVAGIGIGIVALRRIAK